MHLQAVFNLTFPRVIDGTRVSSVIECNRVAEMRTFEKDAIIVLHDLVG